MMRTFYAASAALFLATASMQAFAADRPMADVPAVDHGGSQPGTVAPEQIKGKRLLDANGAEIGQITGIDKDGQSALVRAGGQTLHIPLSRLSLGTGSNTVIEASDSSAEMLNHTKSVVPMPPAE